MENILIPLIIFLINPAISIDINTTEFIACACDMTSITCDVYCCCDQDCTENQRKAFDCKFDVNLLKQLNSWKCDIESFGPQNPFASILCIEKENTPYLGLFHTNIPVISGLPSANDLLQKVKFKDYEITQKHESKSNKNKQYFGKHGYIHGQELSVIQKNLQTSFLYIPYNLYSSKCDALYPVQYLNDVLSTCVTDVRTQCLSPYMDSNAFMLGSEYKQLLSTIDDEIPMKNISVNFYKPVNLCCYLNSKECATESCDVNNLKRLTISSPLSPQLQNNRCNNALLEVKYLFLWSGNRIISADLTVIIANIPITNKSYVTQRFSVVYNHLSNQTSDKLVNNSANMSVSNLGYLFEDPVIGLSYASVDMEFDDVNQTNLTASHLYLWGNDINNNCVVGSKPVLMGMDRLSGCYYKVSDWDNLNCFELRDNILELQSEIFPFEFLSRRSYSAGHDFVKIINDFDVLKRTTEDSEICYNVPDHVHLDILYTEVLRTVTGLVYKILGAVRSVKSSTWVRDGNLKSSSHKLISSVNFRYIFVEEQQLQQKLKRSHLPLKKSWQIKEDTTWKDFISPLRSVDFGGNIHHLKVFLDVFYLIVILIMSVAFLCQMTRQSNISSAERP